MAHFTDIQTLSAKQLKAYCGSCNVDVNLPKAAKINAVCHCLGILTCGGHNNVTSERLVSLVELYTLQDSSQGNVLIIWIN